MRCRSAEPVQHYNLKTIYFIYIRFKSSCQTDHRFMLKEIFNWTTNFALHRRAAVKSRIPRPVLSPVQQPSLDAFGNSKRPMTATYRADSPTSPSGNTNNKIEHTSTRSVYATILYLPTMALYNVHYLLGDFKLYDGSGEGLRKKQNNNHNITVLLLINIGI